MSFKILEDFPIILGLHGTYDIISIVGIIESIYMVVIVNLSMQEWVVFEHIKTIWIF